MNIEQFLQDPWYFHNYVVQTVVDNRTLNDIASTGARSAGYAALEWYSHHGGGGVADFDSSLPFTVSMS